MAETVPETHGAAFAPSRFDADTAVRRIAHDAGDGARARFEADVSPDWRAGRGPHGGYLAAMILRALCETMQDPERTPRSLTIHYARAPKPGAVTIATAIERAGRSLSTLSARMEQEGKLMALALAAFSLPWSAPDLDESSMPPVAPPDPRRETLPALAERVEQGLAPRFLRHLVVQPRLGAPPFTGGEGPMQAGGWIGLGDPARPIDQLALALFSDALYSPPFVRLSAPATSPTIDLTIHFRTHDAGVAARAGELVLARFRSRVVHEGFFEEDGEIWDARGMLLAHSRQLAILMPLAPREG